MRKFNLYDKVVVTRKDEEPKNGCIVGFTTMEEDGCIIDKPSGNLLEPQEHAYNVIIGEADFTKTKANVRIEECFESELSLAK